MSDNKNPEEEGGCLAALVSIPVFIFMGWLVFVFDWDFSSETDPVEYTPPTAEEKAILACGRAISREYSGLGYDAFRLADQRKTAYEREDGAWVSRIAIPFKQRDAITGKRNRTWWINVECVVDNGGRAELTVTDTAGYGP